MIVGVCVHTAPSRMHSPLTPRTLFPASTSITLCAARRFLANQCPILLSPVQRRATGAGGRRARHELRLRAYAETGEARDADAAAGDDDGRRSMTRGARRALEEADHRLAEAGRDARDGVAGRFCLLKSVGTPHRPRARARPTGHRPSRRCPSRRSIDRRRRVPGQHRDARAGGGAHRRRRHGEGDRRGGADVGAHLLVTFMPTSSAGTRQRSFAYLWREEERGGAGDENGDGACARLVFKTGDAV